MVHRDEHEAGIRERSRLLRHLGLVAGLPATAMYPEDDGQVLRGRRRMDVEHLTFVPLRNIGDVAGHLLRPRLTRAAGKPGKNAERDENCQENEVGQDVP